MALNSRTKGITVFKIDQHAQSFDVKGGQVSYRFHLEAMLFIATKPTWFWLLSGICDQRSFDMVVNALVRLCVRGRSTVTGFR